MSAKRKTTVGVVFGGRSVEHDVSIITGHQIMRAFDPEDYEVVPIYIDRDGKWYTGEPLLDLKNMDNEVVSLKGVDSAILSPSVQHHGLIVNPISGRFEKSEVRRLDVVFPAVHGSHGEDGTLQGLLELADIAYVGCGVLASAIANDKIMTKIVLSQQGIPVVEAVSFSRAEWLQAPDKVISHILHELKYPVFVKPARLGSSVGIAKVADENMLYAHMEIALDFDQYILVESAVEGAVEINCAVMGNGDNIRASVLEQPISASVDQVLTFEEKYMRGGEGMKSAERLIPAPISPELTEQIKQMAIKAFRGVDGRGTARVDFLLKPNTEEVFLNEINTMPGSLAFYLWQEDGLSAREVVHQLVELAKTAHADKRQSTYNYQTNLIALTASRGLKGVKGSKTRSVTESKPSN